jgi:hypothetical protein
MDASMEIDNSLPHGTAYSKTSHTDTCRRLAQMIRGKIVAISSVQVLTMDLAQLDALSQ